ncbi:hypothetical protein E4T56_gene2870 [Termitomyces sp. T112]|nr:hypothetical protein E4T56_gene2870 [Termitomyces sp. T112]
MESKKSPTLSLFLDPLPLSSLPYLPPVGLPPLPRPLDVLGGAPPYLLPPPTTSQGLPLSSISAPPASTPSAQPPASALVEGKLSDAKAIGKLKEKAGAYFKESQARKKAQEVNKGQVAGGVAGPCSILHPSPLKIFKWTSAINLPIIAADLGKGKKQVDLPISTKSVKAILSQAMVGLNQWLNFINEEIEVVSEEMRSGTKQTVEAHAGHLMQNKVDIVALWNMVDNFQNQLQISSPPVQPAPSTVMTRSLKPRTLSINPPNPQRDPQCSAELPPMPRAYFG